MKKLNCSYPYVLSVSDMPEYLPRTIHALDSFDAAELYNSQHHTNYLPQDFMSVREYHHERSLVLDMMVAF